MSQSGRWTVYLSFASSNTQKFQSRQHNRPFLRADRDNRTDFCNLRQHVVQYIHFKLKKVCRQCNTLRVQHILCTGKVVVVVKELPELFWCSEPLIIGFYQCNGYFGLVQNYNKIRFLYFVTLLATNKSIHVPMSANSLPQQYTE